MSAKLLIDLNKIKANINFWQKICQQGIEVLGASSDHLILDIEESPFEINIGDTLEFQLYYGPMLHLSKSNDIQKFIIN